jgi:hypothetical protein
MTWVPRYTEDEVREAVAGSVSLAAAMRLLGLRPAGGNYKTLWCLIEHYRISTDHLDPNWVFRGPRPTRTIPLEEILVEHSTYNRWRLKERLYREGIKQRVCELCGQGEMWHGRGMALILDHINGVGDENRITNLRVVCPNCTATFDTHCGRQNRVEVTPRVCQHCQREFWPKYHEQRYCSHPCGAHADRSSPHPERRNVQRPPYDVLIEETQRMGFSAVGRKYGVSDNAVRKWIRWHEAAAERRDAA